jgi:eukaryotic-like serine/threonine-protein kinase
MTNSSLDRTECTRRSDLLLDQNAHWLTSQRVRAEDYLRQDPDLRESPEVLLDLLCNEVRLREELGETPGVEEFISRFPDLEEQLRLQFAVQQAMRPGQVLTEIDIRDFGDRYSPLPSIAGYAILEELGHGAMGVVYKARHLRLNRLVALKMILAGPHAGLRDLLRFEREARAFARLQHPNIVQIHEIGEQDGRPFLCLEFVDGCSLSQLLRGRTLPPMAAARLVECLARAVDHAHQQGIIHRDLKPANVLLARRDGGRGTLLAPTGREWGLGPHTNGEDGGFFEPKIADFGLAYLLDHDGEPITLDTVGTPPYMSPEQANGSPAGADRSTDIYALGAVLYETLTGRPPFLGATVREILDQIRTLDPVAPNQLQPNVPHDLETICLACLRKEPNRRYASAAALADDLARFLRGEPIHARPTSTAERLWKWCRRRPSHAALVLLSVFLLLAALIGTTVHNQIENNRIAHVRETAEQLMREGQQALEAQDVDTARDRFGAAWIAVQAEPSLQSMHTGVVGWLIHSERAVLQRGWKQRIPPRPYDDRRDEALLHSLLLDNRDPKSVKSARMAIRGALALTLPTDPAWGRERELLALVEADLLRPDVNRALARLNEDNAFPSRLTFERRADYLEALTRNGEAATERQRAAQLPPEEAQASFLAAMEHLRRGDLDGAGRRLEQVLDKEPGHFTARLFQGVCFLRQNRPVEARIALTASVAQRPGFAWSYLLRGQAYIESRAPTAALLDFRRALERLPEPERKAFWQTRILTVPGFETVHQLPEFVDLQRFAEGTNAPKRREGS